MKKGLLTFLLALLTTTVFAQENLADWEYQPYPDLPFTIQNVELDLTIDKSTPLISGSGIFNIVSRRSDLTQIVFNTSDLEIRSISSNENEMDYRVSSDSLIIMLADTLKTGESLPIMITWDSSSPYGIHRDVYGNLWTSLNPKSRYHWIPIPDHPEVTAKFQASVTIPADHELVFNGVKMGDEVVSTENKTVSWETTEPISVSGISMALGKFEEVTARSGVKQISFFASENSLMPEVRDGLLSIAVSILKNYEQRLNFEYPFESLNIVVLPDHHWEEIQSGAGIIYLYQNLGPLGTQLKRGIAEQWFGNYHRYLNAPDNRYEFLKVLLTDPSTTEQLKNPDELQSVFRWNLWKKGIPNLENEYLRTTIENSLPDLVKIFEGVTGWMEYADYWYDETGIYWDVLPEVQILDAEEETTSEGYTYNVEYLYDEMNSTLTLVFEAEGEPIESLVGVEVTEFSFTDTVRSEIAFTGMRDSVSVDILTGIDYLTLNPVTDLVLSLNENKPFMFWIRQLSSSVPEDQIQAAKELQNYTQNPDLQLALRDVLQQEENPDVRAALLETLSEITGDASGTEETFLANLNSDDLSIRLSGLKALANYEDNESVKYAVRNVLLRAEKDTLFNTALKTYQQITGARDLVSLAEQLGSQNEEHERAIQVLKVSSPLDSTRQSITVADRYALGEYPFSIQRDALQLLLAHEQNEDYWLQTLPMFFEDRDARVRYHALNAIEYINENEAQELLQERLKEELDPRVSGKIRQLMD
ncbi:hypothetical protein [Gracilimonas sp.]|uniref:hypothetical protein n=1 Tax=Gracilimonas sp. TaxID=1974203 RepID=UPI002871D534|nr:hypothetical protein [Gracilimonas sp.]